MSLPSAVPGVMAQAAERDEVGDVVVVATLAYWDVVVDLFGPSATVGTLAVGISEHDSAELTPTPTRGLVVAWNQWRTLGLR